jgi:hypothetical protein
VRWLVLGGLLAVAVAGCSSEEGEPYFDPERYPLSNSSHPGEACGDVDYDTVIPLTELVPHGLAPDDPLPEGLATVLRSLDGIDGGALRIVHASDSDVLVWCRGGDGLIVSGELSAVFGRASSGGEAFWALGPGSYRTRC